MKRYFFLVALLLVSCSCHRHLDDSFFSLRCTDVQTLARLFPASVSEIDQRVALVKEIILQDIAHIIAVSDAERTFENTVQAYDELGRKAQMVTAPLDTLFLVSPVTEIRETAYAQKIALQQFLLEHIVRNAALYNAFKSYVRNKAPYESLDSEQQYYLQEVMRSFVREGMELPPADLERVCMLKKKLSEQTAAFSRNIYNAVAYMPFTKQELAGVPAQALKSLKVTQDGRYLVGLDYPTVYAVLRHAHSESTRKKVFIAFEGRAYPANYALLKEVSATRDELARLLGFASYAAYDLDDEMAKNPETVEHFEYEIAQKAEKKARKEYRMLTKKLPASVTLTVDGKVKPWDWSYLKEWYCQTTFKLDTAAISEYFPADYVVSQICAVYQRFLDIRFVQEPCSLLWSHDIRCISVYDADNQLLGFLILDLYPRPNKYTHAALNNVINGQKTSTGLIPAVVVMIANLPQGTDGKPGLFTFDDVKTFFHEFGHAMHAILGATRMHGFSGINTKLDFVEMPSQMFEEWLYDSDVLKVISKHYLTGKSLSNTVINKLIRFGHFDIGDFVMRQVALGRYSLEMFIGAEHDIQRLYEQLMNTLRPYLHTGSYSRFPANFDHLMEYGARYYSYLWSRVFAIDILMVLKKYGLQNPFIGRQFADKILKKGGSVEPAKLLRDFLGRNPSDKAFFAYYKI